ncbi:MAG: flagellar biosynthesis anti-sigma factor FlgM [Thermodesulfobacteria bacterium]|nr:flagellar biosynthesis anti-sigma factor FlgM [Thermodesulfobacteriota bacterium]
MKIGDQNRGLQIEKYLNTQAVGEKQQNQQEINKSHQKSAVKTDTVEFSSQSKLLNKVTDTMKTQEPQRAEKLENIKERVQNGTYEVDAEKVANAMFKDLLKDLG